MSLAPGRRVGSYEVIARVGAGGMGEVFRARDATLHRDVALKVLPDVFAHDADRLERFEREAVVLASLNHPNIAQIYGVEDTVGHKALVLEFVEGPTLSDRIVAGPVPLDEALAIARQIADALGAAHDAGIIHRDLKPGNIKLRPDGIVKVLDFGLAKVLTPVTPADLAQSPTLTSPAATARGLILGTAAYMSPEQARGKAIDERADIWAFGVVLAEMVTGQRLFVGDDPSETIAAVIKVQPDLGAVPARVRRLIGRCLEKDPRRRLHDIHDVWDLLEEARPDHSASWTSTRRWWVAAAAVALTAAAFVAGLRLGPGESRAPTALRRLRLDMPAGVTLPTAGPQIVLSPDGGTLVYRAQSSDGVIRLYRRQLSGLDATPIPGTENVRYQGPPFFSPDGQWVAFLVGTRLMKVNLGGGQPELVAELPRGKGVLDRTGWNWGGGAWGSDGMLVMTLFEGGLIRVPASGGDIEVLAESGGTEHWYQHPQILQDGRAILFTSTMAQQTDDLLIFETETRRTRALLRGGAGRVLPTGHLVFVRGGTLWAAVFDLDRLEVMGEPKPVEPGVRHGGVGTAWTTTASDGSLAYVAGPVIPRPLDTLVWVDRRGVETPVASFPGATIADVRLSPGGDRIAVTQWEGESRIKVWNVAGLAPLTPRDEFQRLLVWSPDGRHVVYAAQREGREDVYWHPIDRPAEARPLLPASERGRVPMAFSPDGRYLVTQTATSPAMIHVLQIAGGLDQPASLVGEFAGMRPAVSRDGRWIAYEVGAEGQLDVWVRPFPNVSALGRQLSVKGGNRPTWSSGTDELFFLELGPSRRLVAVDTRAGRALEDVWPSRPLFPVGAYVLRVWRHYDVTADGQRFLMAKTLPVPPPPAPQIVLVHNWFDELNRLVPLR